MREEVRGELGGGTLFLPNNFVRTYQEQIHESQLSGLAIGDRITGIASRLFPHPINPDAWPDAGPITWTDYEITLAQAAGPITSFGTNFAANMVAPQLVRGGPLTVPQGSFTDNPNLPPQAPNEWGYEVVFDQPYAYAGGDLVLMISYQGGSAASIGYMDALYATQQNSAVVRAIEQSQFRAATGGGGRATIVRLTTEAASTPGDIDGDGDVDLSDLALLLANFGCTGADCVGDLDGDAQVGLSDLTILLAHFGG